MKYIAILITNLARLAVIKYQIYSLAITIAGREECLASVRDPLRIASMQLLQDIARGEIQRLEQISESLRSGIFFDFQPRR